MPKKKSTAVARVRGSKVEKIKAEVELDSAIQECVDRIYNVYLEDALQKIDRIWAIGEEVLRLLNRVKDKAGQESYTLRKVSDLLSERGIKRVSPTALSKAVAIVQSYNKDEIKALCAQNTQLGSEILYMLTTVPDSERRRELLRQAAAGMLTVNDLRGMLVVDSQSRKSRDLGSDVPIHRLAARIYSTGIKRVYTMVTALTSRLQDVDLELEQMESDEVASLIKTLDSVKDETTKLASACLELSRVIDEKFEIIQSVLVSESEEVENEGDSDGTSGAVAGAVPAASGTGRTGSNSRKRSQVREEEDEDISFTEALDKVESEIG